MSTVSTAPRFSQVKRALALANVVNIGYGPVEARTLVDAWVARQLAQSLDRVDELAAIMHGA